MVFRCILPEWCTVENPGLRRAVEGEFSEEKIRQLNEQGYNIYFLPNYPSIYDSNTTVDGSHIDNFKFVFVDMDLKDKKYQSKQQFIDLLLSNKDLEPTVIVDSGNGVHAYWAMSDLDAMSFLKLQRRLIRLYDTDEAVAKIYQLMRQPDTYNTKVKGQKKLCQIVYSSEAVYTCEYMDSKLPILTVADEEYCSQHYNKTHSKEDDSIKVDDKIPLKFHKLVNSNNEVKDIWIGNIEDRSKADYRLGHIMHGNGFTKDEAMSVLVNTAKALQRPPRHRISYAKLITDKIWTFEVTQDLSLSTSVKDILTRAGSNLKGTRFPCYRYIDDTSHGFRLGQVIGLVAGVGVGKTAFALNMFMGFVKNNPDCDHFFVPLEQPKEEIAERWQSMCGTNTNLHDKVQVLSNYGDDGSYRNLSLSEIKDYIKLYQNTTGRKVGCVVIDHIGVLKKKTKDGENQGIMDICHEMKSFAIETETLLVMQSQAPREKAGIGDLELNKDAAYGTVFFEAYCDYLITLWQPLKRMYKNKDCPTVTAFKFCKIRHKKQGEDAIIEDVPYRVFFDPKAQLMRQLSELEEKAFDYFNNECMNARKRDRRTDLVEYVSIKLEDTAHGEANSSTDNRAAKGA